MIPHLQSVGGSGFAPRGVDPGGNGPHDGDMNERIAKLETRLDTVLPTLATKSDIADLKSEFAKNTAEVHKISSEFKSWMLATVLAIIGVGCTIAFGLFTGIKGLVDNAKAPEKTSSSVQQQAPPPIIINVPPPAAIAPPPAPEKKTKP